MKTNELPRSPCGCLKSGQSWRWPTGYLARSEILTTNQLLRRVIPSDLTEENQERNGSAPDHGLEHLHEPLLPRHHLVHDPQHHNAITITMLQGPHLSTVTSHLSPE